MTFNNTLKTFTFRYTLYIHKFSFSKNINSDAIAKIKFTFKTEHGRDPPELIVQPKIGEEAGCYENNFQRQCGARRA